MDLLKGFFGKSPLQKSPPFRFHDNHGRNVKFWSEQQTAERRGGHRDGGGILMSRDPMETYRLYEVRINEKESEAGWPLPVGAVTSSPDGLEVPDSAYGWQSAVVVYSDSIVDRGTESYSDIGRGLLNLPVASSVGVSLDSKRILRVHVNGEIQSAVPCSPLPDPCYAMFELRHPYKLVTSLPVTPLYG